MARIFVSHSSQDNAIAADIMTWLRANGFDQTFLDIDKQTGIQPGMNWERTLYQQIDSSQAVILILTANWLDSKWCFAEFTQARALGKSIFPVIVAPGGERFIAPDIQQLDLRQDREGGLERLRSELVQLALDAQGGFAWDPQRPPYPGLLSFEAEDAAIFFGRDEVVRRLIERLSARRVQGAPNVIALLGASGSGKSSVMRAGVLPRLSRDQRNWIVLPPFRPRLDPVGEFARAAAEAIGKPEDWRSWRERFASEACAAALHDLTEALQTATGAREAHILIAVDQFEELFTVTPEADREQFLCLLGASGDERAMFVTLLSIRSDFLGVLQRAATGVVRFEEFSLGPMQLPRLREIIAGPAHVVGLTVEEALIAAAMRDAGTEDALPLLAFTLRELYDRSAGERGTGDAPQLTLAQYAGLGDPAGNLNPLENSVRRRADEVLADARLAEDEMAVLREAFVGGMVKINDDGEYSRRPAFVDELPEKALPALERLAAARLVIFSDQAGRRTVEAAHEALLRKWPRLRAWLDEERDFLIGRMQLDRALADWLRADAAEKTAALLQGLLLSRAKQWLVDHPRSLNPAETDFVTASVAEAEAEARRRRMLRRGLVLAGAGVLAAIVVAAGLVWLQQRNVEAAQREAAAAERGANATLLAFQARADLQANELAAAAAAATTAVETLSTAETRASLFEVVMAISPNLRRSTSDASLRPSLLVPLPGTPAVLIGSRDGRLQVWQPDGEAGPRPFAAFAPTADSGPRPPVPQALQATKVGGAIVALDDGRLVRFDAAGTAAGETKLAPDIDKAALAAAVDRLVIASQTDRKVSTVACAGNTGSDCSGTPLADDYATALAIDKAGRRAALALQERGLVLADLAAPVALRPVALEGNPQIRALSFDDTATRLAVGTVDGRLYLVDAEGGVEALPSQQASVSALAWNASATRLAAACDDFAVCIWEVSGTAEARLAARLVGHNNTISAIAWSADGAGLISADIGGTVDSWTLDPTAPAFFTLAGADNAPLTDIDLSSDGHWLAAGTGTGRIDLWDRQGAFDKALTAGGLGEIRSLRWHPSKPWLAAADENGRVTVWSWPDGEVIDGKDIGEGVVDAIRWLPDGNSLAAGTLGGAIRVWPLGGKPVEFNTVHPEAVLGLAVVPGQDRLLSTDANGNLWLWDLATRDRVPMDWPAADAAVDTLAVDHGGTRVLTAGNGGVLYIYDLDRPGAPQRIDLSSEQIDGAAWSPDDRMIAAVDTDGSLKIWSLAEGAMFLSVRLRGAGLPAAEAGSAPFGHLRHMVWLPGGQAVAIATASGKIVIADLDPAAWIARVRSVFPAGTAPPPED